ncbi:4252_t:CDS:2, partial [Racocetra persica]
VQALNGVKKKRVLEKLDTSSTALPPAFESLDDGSDFREICSSSSSKSLTLDQRQKINPSLNDKFCTQITENLIVEKKNLITETFINLSTDLPIDNTVPNKNEKSSDTMSLYSQIKSHNIQLSIESRDM